MAKNELPVELWERQPSESAKAFEAFVVYRDMGSVRSVRKVGQHLDKSRTQIGEWSSRHEWVKRAAAWDAEQDRLARAAQHKAVKEMNERQAKIAVNIQGKMLNALNQLDMSKLKPQDIARFFELSLKQERIARGADAVSQQSEETKPAAGSSEEKGGTAAAWIEAMIGGQVENG